MNDDATSGAKTGRVFWRKLGRWTTWTVAVVLTLVVLFYQVERWRGAREWKAAKAEYLAAGGLLDLMRHVPVPVPDEQNFGALPIFQDVSIAGSEVGEKNRKRLSRWREGLGTNRVPLPPSFGLNERHRESYLPRWAEFLGVDGGGTLLRKEAAEKVLEAIDARAGDVLADLAAGADRPESQLPPEFYEQLSDRALYEMGLPQMMGVLDMVRLLHGRGIAAVEVGDRRLARESIAMALQLGRLCGPEWMIGVLVRNGIDEKAMHIAEEGILAGVWTNEDLEWISRQFHNPAARAELQEAFVVETIAVVQFIGLAMSDGKGFDIRDLSETKSALKSFLRKIAPEGWYNLNRALALRLSRPALELDGGNEQFRQMWMLSEEVEQELGRSETFSPSRYQVAMLYPALSRAVRRSMQLETGCRLVRTACAIELHRRETGALPRELTDLVPDYLVEVPTDLMDGNPVRYRGERGGTYTLYMIGFDGVDNGGTRPDPESRSRDGTDVVWGRN